MAPPTRRRVLGFVGAASTTLLAGCAVEDAVFGEDVQGGHVFLYNNKNDEERAGLVVTDKSDGERVINGMYRIPGEHALQFEEVLESGNTYEFWVVQPGQESRGEQNLSVTVKTCREGDPSDKLDVLVQVTSHGPDMATFGCDETYSRRAEVTYVEPSEYWIGKVTRTPTPGSTNRRGG